MSSSKAKDTAVADGCARIAAIAQKGKQNCARSAPTLHPPRLPSCKKTADMLLSDLEADYNLC